MSVHKKAFGDQSKSEVDTSSRAGGIAGGPQPADVCASGASKKPIKISSHSVPRLHLYIFISGHHLGCIDTVSCDDGSRPCTHGITAIEHESIVRPRTTVAMRLLPPSPTIFFLNISPWSRSHITGLQKQKQTKSRFQLLELTIITPPGWHLSVDTEARLIPKSRTSCVMVCHASIILYGVS